MRRGRKGAGELYERRSVISTEWKGTEAGSLQLSIDRGHPTGSRAERAFFVRWMASGSVGLAADANTPTSSIPTVAYCKLAQCPIELDMSLRARLVIAAVVVTIVVAIAIAIDIAIAIVIL
jgi:hypothetical protein